MVKQIVSILLVLAVLVCLLPTSVDADNDGNERRGSPEIIDIQVPIRERAIEKWTQYGIIRGDSSGDFRPDDEISRAEMSTIMVRLIGYSSQSASQPNDLNPQDWFYSDMMKLVAAGIMQGSDGYIRPYDPMTREEAVTIIARAFKVPEVLDGRMAFYDWDDISDWAKGFVLNMWTAGYLRFFGEHFSPSSNITRIETLMIIDLMFAAFYSQPGIYSGTIIGNVIIKCPDVKLKDAHIYGDIYVVEGVGDGYYSIYDSVVIEGTIHSHSGKANPYPHIDPNAPMVALTYDDGPAAATPRILDTLEAYGARATFFVVGYKINSNRDTIRRAADIGCELAGHTWSHTNLTSMSRDTLIRDTERVSDAIFEETGIRPALVRPPNGSYNSTSISILGSLGISTIHWSIDPQDWSHLNANTTYSRIMSNIRDGAIVLMHDLVSSTGRATEMLVPELVSRGYQLVTVSELLAYSDIGLQPDRIYFSKYNYR